MIMERMEKRCNFHFETNIGPNVLTISWHVIPTLLFCCFTCWMSIVLEAGAARIDINNSCSKAGFSYVWMSSRTIDHVGKILDPLLSPNFVQSCWWKPISILSIRSSAALEWCGLHGIMNTSQMNFFSEKGKIADDSSLSKTLFYDIARQSMLTAVLSPIDTENCYNSIEHVIVSLFFSGIWNSPWLNCRNVDHYLTYEIFPPNSIQRFYNLCRELAGDKISRLVSRKRVQHQ